MFRKERRKNSDMFQWLELNIIMDCMAKSILSPLNHTLSMMTYIQVLNILKTNSKNFNKLFKLQLNALRITNQT